MGTKTIKTLKVRVFPRADQIRIFKQCAGAHRFFWNKAKAFQDSKYTEARLERAEELEAMDDIANTRFFVNDWCERLHGCKYRHQD